MRVEALRLKRASMELVKSLGGIEVAAEVLDKGKSTVGRWVNRNDPESVNAIDLAELEAVAPAPLVTMALCRIAGGVFVPLPRVSGGDDALLLRVAELARELGDVSGKISEGLADDNALDGSEAQEVLAELEGLEAVTAGLRLCLTAIVEAEKGYGACQGTIR